MKKNKDLFDLRPGYPWGKSARGQISILAVTFFVTLFLLAGFGVDTANVIIKQKKLQRAVDAAAFAAADQYPKWVCTNNAGDPSCDDQKIAKAEKAGREIALMNMQKSGLDIDQVTITVKVWPRGNKINIDGKYRSPTIILGAIPGLANFGVAATTEVQQNLDRIAVMLILDASTSMCGAKMDMLRTSAHNFVDLLPSGPQDSAYVGLVMFGVSLDTPAAKLLSGLVELGVGTNKADLLHLIDNSDHLSCGGYTPMQAGVVEALKEFKAKPAIFDDINVWKSAVLFTDGVPNVIQGCFTDLKTPVTPWPATACSSGTFLKFFNYYHKGNLYNFNRSTYLGSGTTGYGVTSCSNSNECSWQNDIYRALNSIQWIDSNGNSYTNASTIKFTDISTKYNDGIGKVRNIMSLGFLMPIIESDNLRNYDGLPLHDVVIYTIGFGQDALESTFPNDPYQGNTAINGGNYSYYEGFIHSYLLRRIANDTGTATDPQFFPGIPNFNSGKPRGKFYPARTAAELTQAFKEIYKEIVKPHLTK